MLTGYLFNQKKQSCISAKCKTCPYPNPQEQRQEGMRLRPFHQQNDILYQKKICKKMKNWLTMGFCDYNGTRDSR